MLAVSSFFMQKCHLEVASLKVYVEQIIYECHLQFGALGRPEFLCEKEIGIKELEGLALGCAIGDVFV